MEVNSSGHSGKPADAEEISLAAYRDRLEPGGLVEVWRRYQEALAEVNASEEELPEDGELLTRYHGLRDQIWQARPTDPAGLAVQLRFFQETLEAALRARKSMRWWNT